MAGSNDRTVAIAGAIGTVLPSVIGLIQAVFVKQNPGQPPLTDEECKRQLYAVCDASLKKDDDWDREHPKT